MCEPITAAIATISTQTMMAASLGIAALSAGAGYMAQQKQAESSAKYAAQSQASAIESMLRQTEDLNARGSEEAAATALRTEDARRKAQSASSTANASSEAAGLSFDALMGDYDRQYLNFADSQMQQLGFQTDQIERTREGLKAQTESRVNTAQSQIKPAPSLFGTLASFGADAMGTVQSFQVRDPFTGNYTI